MRIKSIIFSLLTLSLSNFLASPTLAFATTSAKCPGESGYMFTNYRGHATRNPTKGGFVSNSAFVDDSAYIAPTAAVCNSASVLKYARIYGTAVISGEAEVTDKARVFGNARVSGTAFVGGEAKVSDHAQVTGEAIVEGVTWVRGYTKVSSGHVTEGTKKNVKPQSVIKAEKLAAAQEAKRLAAEKERTRIANLKQKAKDSIKDISKLLRQGDYSARNDRRQTETTYSWSVSETYVNDCKIEMKRSSTERGQRSGKKIGKSYTKYFTISLKSYNFSVQDESSYEINPTYCIHNQYRDRYSFCFSSYNKRNELLDKMKYHSNNYCRL
jgi:carbonic anhydrase/acetyltransferase-like protein (isoleucine patch superfamily)